MKRAKKLFVLLGIFAAVCIATFVITRIEERKENIQTSGEVVLSVSPDEVTALKWECGDTSLSFHKAGTWRYDEDEAFPVDEERLEELLDTFSSFGVSFTITDVTDYSLYGLDKPACSIVLSTEDESYTITLGTYSKMDEERYVSIGDGNVFLAKIDPLSSFDIVLDDLICHDKSLSYETVEQITFTGSENYTIFRDADSDYAFCSDDLYYTERNGETVPLDTDRVGSYIGSLASLDLTDYVTYNATDDELAACGLLAPELSITVDYTTKSGEKASYVLSVSRDSEELAEGKEENEVASYVRVGDSQIIYRISAYNSNNLHAASYDALRHREVLIADFEDVTQIDTSLDDATYSITADEEDERTWKFGETEVDLSDLQEALEGLKVEYSSDFTSERPTGKQEISLTVHLKSETRPTVQLELYRQDGEHCLAVVDGEVLALVPRSDAVALIEAVNAIVLD